MKHIASHDTLAHLSENLKITLKLLLKHSILLLVDSCIQQGASLFRRGTANFHCPLLIVNELHLSLDSLDSLLGT